MEREELMKGLQEFCALSKPAEMAQFCAELVKVHLTNQQCMGWFVQSWLMAIDHYPHTDGRNQNVKQWAAALLDCKVAEPDFTGRNWYFPLV